MASAVWSALSCALLWSALFASVRAEVPTAEPDTLALTIPPCAAADTTEIERVLGLELAAQPNLQLQDMTQPTIRASLRCTATRAELSVRDMVRGAGLELDLELSDTRPEARPRLIALALAELIASCRLERSQPRTLQPTAATEPEPEPDSDSDSDARSGSESEPWNLALGAGLAHAATPTLLEPAVALGIERRFPDWQLAADVAFDIGSRRDADARLNVHTLSLGLAPGWRALSSTLALTLSLGLRLGYAWLRASEPAPGLAAAQVNGPYLAPFARALLALSLSAHWSLRLQFELGYQLNSIRGRDADGVARLALSGLRSCALLGVGFAP